MAEKAGSKFFFRNFQKKCPGEIIFPSVQIRAGQKGGDKETVFFRMQARVFLSSDNMNEIF